MQWPACTGIQYRLDDLLTAQSRNLVVETKALVQSGTVAHPLLRGDRAVKRLLLPVVSALLVAGGIALLYGRPELSSSLWMIGTAVVLAVLLVDVTLSLSCGGFGLDLIAALAMAGILVLGEHLAGIIVALMFTAARRRWSASRRGGHARDELCCAMPSALAGLSALQFRKEDMGTPSARNAVALL